MFKYSHDVLNHRAGVGRRGSGFEVSYWSFYVPLSWCINWFVTTKGVGSNNISSKTLWEEFRATDDADIRLVSNPSTSYANTLLIHADS